MKLDEAIKILKVALPKKHSTLNADYYDAINLGIEALKQVKELRSHAGPFPSSQLPGETEE